MPAAPVLLHHESSLRHETGAHPEQPARIVAIERELESRGWLGWERMQSPPVDRELLTSVHPSSHVDLIQALAARGGGQIDMDTVASAGSYEAAVHAAGGAARMVELLLAGDASYGFSVHRPPGHHAETARAMGFCLFNNVAVAARCALTAGGLDRVMIVDWDVHHGNGTNDIFHASREVLFVSIHQSPLYPGTGPASDVGSGEGEGYTVNLPVPPGSGDATFASLVRDVVLPLARLYEPQLLLISAGYDAHLEDPLAECRVTDGGYAAMTLLLRDAATELEIPLGVVLEGGYALGALARSVTITMAVLAGQTSGLALETADVGAVDVDPLAHRAVERLSRWWPGLDSGR
jgi:acetoin utilization deacetylase AcuC-like enzyme